MSYTDTETQTPVEASNAAAALPGGSGAGPAPSSPAGGARAASGLQEGASTAASVSQPYARMTTPTAAWAVAGGQFAVTATGRSEPTTPDDEDETLTLDALAITINDRGGMLRRGDTGPAVRQWQTFLNAAGFTDGAGRPLEANGAFRRHTREATKAFQRSAEIAVDGEVGPETFGAALYTIDPSSSPMPGEVAYADGRRASGSIIAPAEDMPSRPGARSMLAYDAALAAQRAARQRMSGAPTTGDRFRPRDMQRQGDVMLRRSTEAVREFTRGVGDTYRMVVDRDRLGSSRPMGSVTVDAAMVLKADPKPSDAVIGVYAFGGGVPGDVLRGLIERPPNAKPPITDDWRRYADQIAKEEEEQSLIFLQKAAGANLSQEEIATLSREWGDQVRHDVLFSDGPFNTYGGRQALYFGQNGYKFLDWLTAKGYSALFNKAYETFAPGYTTGGRF